MPRQAAPAMTKDDLQYQAEEDVRTLVRAEEIRKDKKRLGRAMTQARKQMDALKQVKK